jgi:signal transduction histidine kinase
MPAEIRQKWRPTLSMIVFVVLATVMALPLIGLFFFRLYENQLIRQTEAELIAQTTVLAAIFAREVEAAPAALALARPVPAAGRSGRTPVGDYHPIEPTLDLAADEVLPRRPEAHDASIAADPAMLAIGARLAGIAAAAQDVTLAGFRLLDAGGVVIGGRDETGRSLAHIEEVAAALAGRYGNAIRVRVSNSPAPPVYSMSRGTGIRLFVAMPVFAGEKVAGVVYASRTPSNVFRHLASERKKVALAAASIILATALIGFLFSRTITNPIQGLAARAHALGRDGPASMPMTHYGTREIAGLSQSFATMAERLSERSAYIATFAAHVSHELKSPITAIHGAAELMRDARLSGAAMTDEQTLRFLNNILGDTQRLTLLLARLRDLAEADSPATSGTTTLDRVAAQVRDMVPSLAIAIAGDGAVPVAMSQENAVIVLSHLADNAARHGACHLRIDARVAQDRLIVEVADDGEGVSDNNRARIFDPFFTTRRESGGTGMGLGIVRSMLTSHGGTIALRPGGEGAAFRLDLPLADRGVTSLR